MSYSYNNETQIYDIQVVSGYDDDEDGDVEILSGDQATKKSENESATTSSKSVTPFKLCLDDLPMLLLRHGKREIFDDWLREWTGYKTVSGLDRAPKDVQLFVFNGCLTAYSRKIIEDLDMPKLERANVDSVLAKLRAHIHTHWRILEHQAAKAPDVDELSEIKVPTFTHWWEYPSLDEREKARVNEIKAKLGAPKPLSKRRKKFDDKVKETSKKTSVRPVEKDQTTMKYPVTEFFLEIRKLPRLDLKVDKKADFDKWLNKWNLFKVSSGLDMESKHFQFDILKYCLSSYTHAVIEETFDITGHERNPMTALLDHLKDHVYYHSNESLERYRFKQYIQGKAVPFENFYFNLQKKIKTCNFCNDECRDKNFRDQILLGLVDQAFVKKVLHSEPDLTLESLVDLCMAKPSLPEPERKSKRHLS